MRKENAKFDTKFISEAGSYLVNADYFAFVELKDYACYVMADGIDSDERKESAKLAVTTVITEFSETPGMSKGKLKRFLKAAHNALLQEADEIRLEASIVIVLTDYKKIIWGHAGNARLLWIKNGAIKMSTKDTSLTQRMVDQEEIALDQLSMHEERNNLYTYLGQPGRMTPVISKKKKLEDGDIVLLITRGVWENVGDAEIIDAVDGVSKAEDVCTGLEDVILSQRREIIENYSIASIFVNKIYQNPKAGKYKRIFKIVFGIVMAIAILLLTLNIASCRRTQSKMEKIEKYKVDGIEYLNGKKYEDASDKFKDAYELTEDIKTRKNSKNAKKVEVIKSYKVMTESLETFLNYVDTNEYGSAQENLGNVNDNLEKLKAIEPNEVEKYEKIINNYNSFLENMIQAAAAIEKKDYVQAVNCYATARDSMDEINDIKMRDKAMEAYNQATVNRAIAAAESYIQIAVDAESSLENPSVNKMDVLQKAIDNYGYAINMYKEAETYGYMDASFKINETQNKYEAAKTARAALSEDDVLKSVETIVTEAENLAKAGKTQEAQEKYAEAQEMIKDFKSERATNLKEKIEQATGNIDNNPEEHLMNALKYLSKGQYDDAIKSIENAINIYKFDGNNGNVTKLESYIDEIKNLKEKQAAAAQVPNQ